MFFSETVNSQYYCNNILYPFFAQLTEDEINKAYFQQGCATAHASRMSWHPCVTCLPTIILKNIWPPRSPDLTPLDFYLWGAMKNTVYSNNSRTTDDLMTAITEYIRSVDRAALNDVSKNTVQCVTKCLEAGRPHTEHLLQLFGRCILLKLFLCVLCTVIIKHTDLLITLYSTHGSHTDFVLKFKEFPGVSRASNSKFKTMSSAVNVHFCSAQ